MATGKYQPLYSLLHGSKQKELTLPFTRIESLIKSPLPQSAYLNPAWWSNRTRGGVQAHAWLAAGYRVVSVDLSGEHVTFHKIIKEPKLKRARGEIIWNSVTIKALRHHMKLNQVQFAAELGVRQQTVSEWENEAYRPKRSMSKLLAIIADREKFRQK